MYRGTFVVYVLLFGYSDSFTAPIRFRTGITSGENYGHENNGIIYDISSDMEAKNFQNQEGLDRNNERKSIKTADAGSFGEGSAENKHKVDEGQFSTEDFKNKDGSSVSDIGVNNNHKKGHHKSGFHNTYHKDESGSNSSFYDDSNDQGGEYIRNTNKGAYGEQGTASNRGTYLDGNKYDQESRKHGGYDHSGVLDKAYIDNRQRQEEAHRADAERRGQSSRGNRLGGGGGYVDERYHLPDPHFHQGYNIPPIHHHQSYRPPPLHDSGYDRRPPYARSTITVYEDPRYYRRYDRDTFRSQYGPYSIEDNIHHIEPRRYDDRMIKSYRSRFPNDAYFY